jgi:hypothetical protein
MSSAILYLAIIAIWACVLIPRWLRRDSARVSASASAAAVPSDVVDDAAPAATEAGEGVPVEPLETDEVPSVTPRPSTPEESRQRMLAARRRLLGMLLILEVAACALVLLSLAAVWVIVPPSVMLAGYLLLLREAARADAERTHREAAQRAGSSPQATAPAVPPNSAAHHGDGYDVVAPGRDFAPGLAGKYTPSNGEVIDISERDEDYREQGRIRLRAVGD